MKSPVHVLVLLISLLASVAGATERAGLFSSEKLSEQWACGRVRLHVKRVYAIGGTCESLAGILIGWRLPWFHFLACSTL
jgi:hypothetical protein